MYLDVPGPSSVCTVIIRYGLFCHRSVVGHGVTKPVPRPSYFLGLASDRPVWPEAGQCELGFPYCRSINLEVLSTQLYSILDSRRLVYSPFLNNVLHHIGMGTLTKTQTAALHCDRTHLETTGVKPQDDAWLMSSFFDTYSRPSSSNLRIWLNFECHMRALKRPIYHRYVHLQRRHPLNLSSSTNCALP